MKMKNFAILLILSFCIFSCKKGKKNRNQNTRSYSYENNYIESDGYRDGTYCATVEYYNPNTETRNEYTLNVEVENEELIKINFRSGWLDDSDFSSEDISNGECTVTTDRNYEYEVTLNEYGECNYSDEGEIESDIQQDENDMKCSECSEQKDSKYDEYCNSCKEEKETCSKCYGIKLEYEDICSSCKDDIEHTCSNCGGRKFSSFDNVCDDCK